MMPLPSLPPDKLKTYSILQPARSHFRDATCAEVECEQNLQGWDTLIDVSTPIGVERANYIRLKSGRSYTAIVEGMMVRFRFPPGQACFRQHKINLGRPEIFIEREGNARSNPRGTAPRRHTPDTWVDSFQNHQDRLARRMEQG